MALQLSCRLFLLSSSVLLPLSFSLLAGNETDRQSLLAFKAQVTLDPLHVLTSWNESLHFCKWTGVTCGRGRQRLTELNLRSYQLVGRLSPHIGNLSFLKTLDVAYNRLSHDIPQELGRLYRLRFLNLSNNMFSGELPANISRCTNLIGLRIDHNNLTGRLPPELGSLPRLQTFFFRLNGLTGEIPSSFGNLSSLETLSGSLNNLVGAIPDSIGQLKRLNHLAFGDNSLSGIIPPSIYNLSSLAFFSFRDNQLQGSLPSDLGLTLPNLKALNFQINNFGGVIPLTVTNASSLLFLVLSTNKFTGKVPLLPNTLQVVRIQENNLGNGEDDDIRFLYPLVNNTSLEKLDISDNNFGGMMPETFSNFSTQLSIVRFGRNRIHGSIPTEIGNLISLTTLGLESNQLTGAIPNSIGKLQQLEDLYIDDNRFSGSIPASLGNISALEKFSLRRNSLNGSIPSSLGRCQRLLFMDLAENKLTGLIPTEVFGISSLAIMLDLSKNQLTGSLPWEVSKLENLGSLDVSENKLSGEIPTSIGSCLSLESLYLQENHLEGGIPQSLSFVRAIQNLNLSHNNLTGQIPNFLGDLKLLNSLDVSFNELEGAVPVQGVFRNASAVSVFRNKNLCGGIKEFGLPRCISIESTRSNKVRLVIGIACGTAGVILIASFVLFYLLRKNKKVSASLSSMETALWRVAYGDLFKATNAFSPDSLIGAGSFGSVYRGVFEPDDTVLAVKVLNLQQKGASKSFMAECEAWTNIRHRNLVKVLTACSSVDFQGNDFKALVYEFMANGSLDEWLHPVAKLDPANKSRKLNLIQRLNIAIDVATAIDYLHHHCDIPVVHSDLKPSNVLLDGEMTAHVGDFGLARFLPEAFQQSLFSQTSSIGIKGTIGYAAPEYGMGSEVSTYGDVYSYGVLLLEMFTGKRPTDEMFKDELNLHNYAKMASSGSVLEIADPLLLIDNEESSTADSLGIQNTRYKKLAESLISILMVGVSCSAELPRERMDISKAVTELQEVKELLQGGRMG